MPRGKGKQKSGVVAPMLTRSRARKRPGTSSTIEQKSKRQKLLSRSEKDDKNDLEVFLHGIGTKIGDDYFALGTYLGLGKSRIENIKNSSPHNAEQWGYEVITIWAQRHPNELPFLAEALRKIGRVDLALSVDAYSKDNCTRSGNDDPISNITDTTVDFNETTDLKKCLEHMENHNFVVLTGMSGVGRTEIAKFYWHLKKDSYDIGWQMPSNTTQDLRNATLAFLEKLASIKIKVVRRDDSLPALLQNIRTEISRTSKGDRKYLLIFDDAGIETKSVIEQYFNSSTKKNISVILTTQQSFNKKNTVKLEGFTKDEVLKFLSDIEEDDKNKLKLWEELSHLPSALTCAKNDIRNMERSIEHYLDGIKDKELYEAIEKRNVTTLGISYADKSPVGAHVQNAKAMIDDIASTDKQLCFVLKTIAFFYSKTIPEFILRDVLRQKHIDDDKPVKDKHIVHHMDKLLLKMAEKSYVTIGCSNQKDGDRIVDTHCMVQLGIRFAMEENDHQIALEMLMRVLLRYFAKDTRYLTFFRRNKRLIPHVEMVLGHVHSMSFMDITFDMNAMAIAMYDRLGYSYTQDHCYKVAEEKLQKSVDMIYKSIQKSEKDLNRHIKVELSMEKGKIDVDKFTMAKAMFIYDRLQNVGESIVNDLVIHTVLNTADIKLMTSKVGKEKLPPELLSQKHEITTNIEIYEKLVKLDLAIPKEVMKAIYLPELYASVFYSFGRMHFYKKERPKTDLYISNIRLAFALCKIIQNKWGRVVLHGRLSQRNGLLYLYSEDLDEFGKKKSDWKKLKDLYEGKKKYENLLKRTNDENWYQHGILKVTKNDPFHKCVCLEKIIYICTKIMKSEKVLKKREKVIAEGKKAIGRLMKVLGEEEEESKLHKASNFYAVTAEFYEEAKCWDDAFHDYKHAVERCKNSDSGNSEAYAKCCLGIMCVASHINTETEVEAKGVANEFLKGAPKDSQNKEVNKLIQRLKDLLLKRE